MNLPCCQFTLVALSVRLLSRRAGVVQRCEEARGTLAFELFLCFSLRESCAEKDTDFVLPEARQFSTPKPLADRIRRAHRARCIGYIFDFFFFLCVFVRLFLYTSGTFARRYPSLPLELPSFFKISYSSLQDVIRPSTFSRSHTGEGGGQTLREMPRNWKEVCDCYNRRRRRPGQVDSWYAWSFCLSFRVPGKYPIGISVCNSLLTVVNARGPILS